VNRGLYEQWLQVESRIEEEAGRVRAARLAIQQLEARGKELDRRWEEERRAGEEMAAAAARAEAAEQELGLKLERVASLEAEIRGKEQSVRGLERGLREGERSRGRLEGQLRGQIERIQRLDQEWGQ
jgi:hypothetical protein